MSKASVYLIRHGRSGGNVTPHLINGRRNELTLVPVGRQQSELLGRWMGRTGIIPDRVNASPAQRAYDTGVLSLGAAGISREIVIDDALQEIDMGDVTGLPRAEVYTRDVLTEIGRKGTYFRMPGGESMHDVGVRMEGWLDSVQTEGITFAYSHGLAIRCLVGRLCDWQYSEIYSTRTPNTSVSRLDYDADDGRWRLAADAFASVAHLPAELITD